MSSIPRLFSRRHKNVNRLIFNFNLGKNSSIVNIACLKKNKFHTTAKFYDEFTEQEQKEKEEQKYVRDEADYEEKIKLNLMTTALDEVLIHGWSKEAIEIAATKQGLPSTVAGLIKDGGVDLVFHHIKLSNDELDTWMEGEVSRMKTEGSGKIQVGKLVRSAVVKRLLMNAKFIPGGRWAEGVALVSCPSTAPRCLALLQEFADAVWWRAGDTATDYNWYTKRISLAAVYSATELFMLQDESQGFQDTLAFLDRRLQDLQGIPAIARLPEDALAFLSGAFKTVRNMAGVQK